MCVFYFHFLLHFHSNFVTKAKKREETKIRKKKVLSHPASTPGPSGFILYTLSTELDIYNPGRDIFFSFLSCLNNLLCCLNNLIILFAQDNYLVKTT